MYCPSCGAESTGLKYCKRCGINLTTPMQFVEQSPALGLKPWAIWAVALSTVAIGLGGLGITFGVASTLAGEPGVDKGIPIVMTVFGSAAVFGIIAMLISFISRMMGLSQEKEHPRKFNPPVINEHYPTQIPAPPSDISSVTEHTTRNFDAIRSRMPGARE